MLAVDQWIQRAREASIEAEIARRGIQLRKSGNERIGPCPKCGGTDRFSINVKENVWNCRHCKPEDISGDVIGFVEWIENCDFEQAVERLTQEPKPNGDARINGDATGKPSAKREIAWYDYENEDGSIEFQVVRYEPKDFRPRYRLDRNGAWTYGRQGRREIPFRLPELIEGIGNQRIVFNVEGEKDAETMRKLGYIATTNAGGCNSWKSDLNHFFEDADVVIIADHDPQSTNKKTGEKLFHPDGRQKLPGWDHAMHVASELAPLAERVRMFDIAELWRDCPDKCDVTDYFRSGGTLDAFNAFVEKREDWTPDAKPPQKKKVLTILRPVRRADEQNIPLRDWIIPGLLLRKHVTVLVAPSGSGKSLLTLQIGIACAMGRNWAGWRPRRAFRVLVINSEDDKDEIQRRLLAATYRMSDVLNGDPDAYIENFGMIDATNASAVIAKLDPRSKQLVNTAHHDEVIYTIQQGNFDLVFVDPFAETFSADENSNNELKQAGIMWRAVARETKTGICLIHHTKKYSQQMAGDVDAARGAGALIGIARIVSTLFPMTTKEAEAMLGQEKKTQRHFYLRYDDAKANLNAISPFAKWFRKDSITLANSRDDIPGDEVGVLIPWKPEGPMVLEAQIVEFLKRVDVGILDADGKPSGEFFTLEKAGRDNSRWVGFFAQQFFKNSDGSELSLVQAESLIDPWVKNRRLRDAPKYKSPATSKPRSRCVSELHESAKSDNNVGKQDEDQDRFF